jgi:hypothetical protein
MVIVQTVIKHGLLKKTASNVVKFIGCTKRKSILFVANVLEKNHVFVVVKMLMSME